MRNEIIKILDEIEEMENIEILYACESGSRVWGFANRQSDYDVRFIYKKRNVREYLSLKNSNDVIECIGDDFDIVGWDIKKALKLHFKDNPNLREWFLSSEVYIDKGINNIFSDLGEFNIDVLKNHYASIALKHWKKYCNLEFKHDKTKKYLYVIRAILCWNLLNLNIYPPINIWELMDHENIKLNDDIRDAVFELVMFHQGNGDLTEETILKLNNFILSSLSSMKTVHVESHKELMNYDERFRELLLVS